MSLNAPDEVLIVVHDGHIYMQVDTGTGANIEGATVLESLKKKPGERDAEFLQYVDSRISAQATARGLKAVRQHHPDVYRQELAK